MLSVQMSRDLSMRDNSFSYTMPTQLGRLDKLEIGFDFYKNSLAGSVPTELGTLAKLSEHMYLSSNKLSSVLPTQVRATSVCEGV